MVVTTGTLLIDDDELKSKLESHKTQIEPLLRKGKITMFQLSCELYLMRNTCLEHQNETAFGVTVEELGISRRSAYRAISRWEALGPKVLGDPTFGKLCASVAQPSSFEGFLCFARFDDSALDELAKPTTPKKALNQAVKIAQAGKGMTKKEALELIAKYGPKPRGDGDSSGKQNRESSSLPPAPGKGETPPPPPEYEPPDLTDEPELNGAQEKARQKHPDGAAIGARCPNCIDYDRAVDWWMEGACGFCGHPEDQPSESGHPAAVPRTDASEDAAQESTSQKRGKGKPGKQYDRNACFKRYDTAIGPLVREVEKIAKDVGEKGTEHHRTVKEHLHLATAEMMEWMQVSGARN